MNNNNSIFFQKVFLLASILFVFNIVSTSASLSDGLINYWKLDEGSGNVVTDSAGTNDGIFSGNPTWNSNGKIGSALAFDGIDDFVNAGSFNAPNEGTIALWVFPDASDTGTRRIMGSHTNYEVLIDSQNSVSGDIFRNGFVSSAIALGVWTHIVIAYNLSGSSVNIKTYINGIQASIGTGTGTNPGIQTLHIGERTGASASERYKGSVDEVAIWNRQLSVDEINEVYLNGVDTSCIDGEVRSCYTGLAGTEGIGICTAGTESCVNNSWGGVCENEVLPQAEICGDGIDQSCNGADLVCQCISGETRACGSDVGMCSFGNESCVNNLWSGVCEGEVGPTTEICEDGLDQDCNGVDASCVQYWPTNGWNTTTPAEAGMNGAKLIEARDYALSQGGGSGYITRGGRLVMSWGSPTYRYGLKSSTKSIAGATSVGLALQDGLVALNDFAQEHYPEIGGGGNSVWLSQMKVLHLATMTSGFSSSGSSLLFQPGTAWFYSDGATNWLSGLYTKVYAEDLNIILFNRVFTPLGITSNDLRWRTRSATVGTANGTKIRREFSSGISANVNAMAKIGYMYLRDGEWDGQQILPKSFVDKARTSIPEVENLPLHSSKWPGAPQHYGLLWWNNADGRLPDVPQDMYTSWGLFESFIIVIPSLDIVVSRAGDGWRTNMDDDFYGVIGPFITPIVESLCGNGVVEGIEQCDDGNLVDGDGCSALCKL